MQGGKDGKELNIIIISYNCRPFTLRCVESILRQPKSADYDITIVDNASEDGAVDFFRAKYPDIHIIQNERNVGYAAAVNIGVQSGAHKYILASNADVEYQDGSIEKLIDFVKNEPGAGAAGPQQFYPGGRPQASYGGLPGIKLGLKNIFMTSLWQKIYNVALGSSSIKKKPFAAPYIDGAAILFSREIYNEAGGWSEDYFFYTEEADFCRRLKSIGYRVFIEPGAHITHYRGGASEGGGLSRKHIKMLIESKTVYCRKWLSGFEARVYMIMEIVSEVEKIIARSLFFIFMPEKAKQRIRVNSYFIKYWLKELKNYG